jgi:hypothetical protein
MDPNAPVRATVGLTSSQVRQLCEYAKDHTGSVDIDELDDAYARAVLIGPEGERLSERTLFPV